MRIELTWTSLTVPASKSLVGSTVVVIDALRATSTIVTALANGALRIFPVASVETARHQADAIDGSLLGGEREGLKVRGFDLGNSPLEYTPEAVAGKTIVMTTTNGTRALDAARGADEVICGSLLNAVAVARHIADSGCLRLHLACAGTDGEFSLDDAVTAGAILEKLLELVPAVPSLSDASMAALLLYRRLAPDLLAAFSESAHGRRLVDLGLGDDVRFCATVDLYGIVPVLVGRAIGLATLSIPGGHGAPSL